MPEDQLKFQEEAVLSIADLVERTKVVDSKAALIYYEDGKRAKSFTYAELRMAVESARHVLTRTGVREGDRVVLLSKNCPEAYFAELSVMCIGAILVPLNPEESEATLSYILSVVSPTLVVIGDYATGGRDSILNMQKLHISKLFEDSQDAAPATTQQKTLPTSRLPAVILFTSGTTSRPKGVVLSHANLIANAIGLKGVHKLSPSEVHLCFLPLFHANAFGFSLVAALYAMTPVVLCNGFPGFGIWGIIEKESVCHVSAVPQALRLLSGKPIRKGLAPKLRYFVSAAAPLPKAVAMAFIRATSKQIHQGYGLSECVNFATTIPFDVPESVYDEVMHRESVPSIGVPLEGNEVNIRSLDGTRLLDAGEEGEVVVTGRTVMMGYWKEPEATSRALINGELRTGDLGYWRLFDAQRYFFITGRIKDLIIKNGEKYAPLAIEAQLDGLKRFGDFAVVGFDNDATGEEVGLYIVLALASESVEAELQSVLDQCEKACKPRVVVVGVDPIPSTPTGKVRRAALKKHFDEFSGANFGRNLTFKYC